MLQVVRPSTPPYRKSDPDIVNRWFDRYGGKAVSFGCMALGCGGSPRPVLLACRLGGCLRTSEPVVRRYARIRSTKRLSP